MLHWLVLTVDKFFMNWKIRYKRRKSFLIRIRVFFYDFKECFWCVIETWPFYSCVSKSKPIGKNVVLSSTGPICDHWTWKGRAHSNGWWLERFVFLSEFQLFVLAMHRNQTKSGTFTLKHLDIWYSWQFVERIHLSFCIKKNWYKLP
jgi:hypothetical protein